MVFVLDSDADPEKARPVTLFATDPEMVPERIYRIYRDRFQIKFNFRDAKQYLGLAACQARTEARHHFHVNAVLAALAWTRLELRHAADRALDRFSMANVKLKSFLELVLKRLFDTDGLGRTLQKHLEALNPPRIPGGCAVATPIQASALPVRPGGVAAPACAYLKNCSHH